MKDLIQVEKADRILWNTSRIKSWRKFHAKVRSKGCSLLKKMSLFEGAVLVSGCQRSGTTMLSRLISRHNKFDSFSFTKDDELDAALILSGCVSIGSTGPFCFQTTYLNECYAEYFQHAGRFKLIWVLRNPYDVVFSMTNNWDRFALNELYSGCGGEIAQYPSLMHKINANYVHPLEKACSSYIGKNQQLMTLMGRLDSDQLLLVNYDELIQNKHDQLAQVFSWLNLPFSPQNVEGIVSKKSSSASKLSPKEMQFITDTCVPVYDRINNLISNQQNA